MAKARKKRKKSKGKFELRGIWLWVIGGVIVLGLLFTLTRTLSSSAADVAPMPVLATANPDLTALTRMLGDITLNSTPTAGLPEKVMSDLGRVDSMISERSWYDALGLLRGLEKSIPPDRVGVVHGYTGYCQHQAANPDRSLRAFRKALEQSESTNGTMQYQVAFCIGYLFQSRGFADSAQAFYDHARHVAPRDSADPLFPALLNNLGLAHEALGDTAGALALYLEAAAFVDTSAGTRESRTLRDNVRRTYREPEADSSGNRTD